MSDGPPSYLERLDTARGDEDQPGSWLARFVPQSVVRQGLSVRLNAPATVRVGTATEFRAHLRNRLPVPVAVTLPTARLWGWTVAGEPEADERAYDPPRAERRETFAPFETKRVSWSWDGTVRRTRPNGGDVWEPLSGAQTVRAYLSVADPEASGLTAEASVRVVADR